MKALQLNFCPLCSAPMQDQFSFGRMRRACPACGFVFFGSPKLAAGALVEQAGRVLLVQRKFNPKRYDWCLPAGYVDYDEGPVAAALREVREETGLVVRTRGVEGVYPVRTDPRGAGVLIVYFADVDGGHLQAGDDAAEVAFFGPGDLPPNLAFATTRRVLHHWRNRLTLAKL